MINKTLVVNTIQKEIRSKGIIFLFVFTLAVLYGGHVLANVIKSYLDETSLNTFIANSSQSIIIAIVSFCANFVAVMLSSTIVRTDINTRMLPQLLSFPISRLNFLLSRILGGWIISVIFFIFSLVSGILILKTSGNINLDFYSLVYSTIFMIIELIGILVIGTFISLYFSRVVTLISTLVFYTVSKGSYAYVLAKGIDFSEFSVGKLVSLITYYAMPRVGEMSYISESFIAGKTFDYGQLFMALGHFSVLIVIWVFIMKFFFDRREV